MKRFILIVIPVFFLFFYSLFASNSPVITNEKMFKWEFLGETFISEFATSDTDIAFDSNNTPYAVYLDYGNINKAIVKKFESNS